MGPTFAPAIVSTISINAAPGAVWEALIDSRLTVRYGHGTFESDWAAGSPFRQYEDGVLQVEGEILVVDPPRRLVMTFHAVWNEAVSADAPSRVTWEIEQTAPGMSRVTLIHDQLLEGSATLRGVTGAGPKILSGLKTLLETGEPLMAPAG